MWNDLTHRHPSLKVLICKNCFKYYMSGDISRDSDGTDEQCRWCAEGGTLVCCDFCHNAFCKKCILYNLGRKELSTILNESHQWHCYVCRPEPLLNLVAACNGVFENLEQMLQKNKKTEVNREKNSEVCDHTPIASPRKNSLGCNGEKTKLDNSCSDSVPCAYSSLIVPQEMIRKTKELIEITSNTNSSYIKFLKQAADNSEMSSSVKLCQLKAFKSVLADIKKAHLTLEDDLNSEIQALDAVSKETTTKDLKITDVYSKTKIQKGRKSCATENQCFLKLDARSTTKIMDSKHFTVEDRKANKSENKRSSRKDGPQNEPTNTYEDLGIDIVSASSSVPEDIFDSLETVMEVQSSTDYGGGDSNSGTEPELESSPLKLNFPSKAIKSKITATVRKEIYVKLNRVSFSNASVQGTDFQQVPQEKNFSKRSGVAPGLEKCGAKEENSKNEHLGENNVASVIEESDLRRSLHVKTKRLRQQTEASLSISNSDEESNETIKEKKCLSVLIRRKAKQNYSFTAIDNPKPHKVPKSKQARIVDQSSDSDEIQAVLTEVSQMGHCSSDTGINEIQVIHKIHTGKDTNDKRKRRSSTSGSDFGIQKEKPTKSSIISKRTCQNYPESSHYDSELKRKIKIMSTIGLDRVIRRSVSNKKDCDSCEDEMQSKIAVDTERKESVNTEQGMSDDTDGKWEENFTGTDDLVKKCKREVELGEVPYKKQLHVSSDGTEKPSGLEGNVNIPEDKILAKTKENIKHLKIKACRTVQSGSSDATDKFPKKEENHEPPGYKKQTRKKTAAKGDKTTHVEEETVKEEQQHESLSDAPEKFPEGEETAHFLQGIEKSKNDNTDGDNKSKRIKDKLSKNKKELSDSVEQFRGRGDSCDSSENKKNKNEAPGGEKEKCILPGKSSRKRPACLSDTENYRLKGECCDSATKRQKRIKLRERRNLNSKRTAQETQSDSSSLDSMESSEDAKKQKKQKTPDKKKTGNGTEKQSNFLKTTTKSMPSDNTSPSHNVDDGQYSVGEESSDEQKIKPLIESLVLHTHTRCCQSSRDDDALSIPVSVIEDNVDDSSDPENRIARRMLLEEIRANVLSEDEDSLQMMNHKEDK
ncbi:transcriptional regulator ATRX-like [Peromyscus eremicus]|uniref:transcriptional regulator ATRX-like n=1 Tax=Peromyscus eremicus TaxID=42410 RepID=UPI0027DAED7D|nr:transcriptional regulator ATRX-like [Peromyscus eremicus]